VAIGLAGGIGEYPSRLCMGTCGLPGYEASVQITVTSRECDERVRGPKYQISKEMRVMF